MIGESTRRLNHHVFEQSSNIRLNRTKEEDGRAQVVICGCMVRSSVYFLHRAYQDGKKEEEEGLLSVLIFSNFSSQLPLLFSSSFTFVCVACDANIFFFRSDRLTFSLFVDKLSIMATTTDAAPAILE